ncbi:MAG TPA: CBS domain-containing protein [Gammaproteobacteria bacterium]|nr:CBS domain-containing protein [Gammaproteobacteria bacterium]
MTDKPRFVSAATTLQEAARLMRDLDSGFLPVADEREEKLSGVVTDRDITVRAVADGLDPAKTTVTDIKSDSVLYCFKDDDVADAAKRMRDKQVYRLIVLDNRENKKLCGVVSLGDILRHGQSALAAKTAEGIAA